MKNITDLSRDIEQAQDKLREAVATAFAGAIRAACVQVLGPAKSLGGMTFATARKTTQKWEREKLKPTHRAKAAKAKKHVGVLTEMRLKTVDGSPAVEYKLELPDGRRYHGKRKRDMVRQARKLGVSFVEA